MKSSESRSVTSDSLRPHGLYSPWTSPGQNTGVGSLSLVQGVFLTQGSLPGLPHCRWILYQQSKKLGFYSSQWFHLKKFMHHCQNKWKDILNSWTERFTIGMATFSRLIYRFKAILTILAGFFAEIDMLILKFIQKLKGLRIAKTTLKDKNQFKGLELLLWVIKLF